MSPIKDLSENVRMPRLGKFHLGIRDERGIPKKTDYFVIPKDHSDYTKIVKIFGEKPKELRILIPVENEEDWAPQYYKAYNQTYGLVCKGDGETALKMVDITTNELPNKETKTVSMKDMTCQGKECPMYKAKKCGEVMNLRFMLPDVPGLGVWQIDTGSINSILNINSCAKLIKKAFGRISLIPLKLTFEPFQVNNPENGKKQNVYVLNLRTDVTMAQLADAAREQAKTFMLEGADLEAVFDAEIEKDIQELWPEKKPEAKTEEPPKQVAPAPEPEKPQVPAPKTEKIAEKPKEKTKAKAVKLPAEPSPEAPEPKKKGILTLGRVLEWVVAHGKDYNRDWFFRNQSFKEADLIDNPSNLEKAMSEICTMTGWDGIK